MIFLVSVALLFSLTLPQVFGDENDDLYQRMFEEVDVDSILNNDRILDTYLRCFFSTGSCTSHAEVIKNQIPEVWSTVCGKCNDKQKDIFKHCLTVFIPKRPEDWKHMLQIYDPNGEYWPKLQEFIGTDFGIKV